MKLPGTNVDIIVSGYPGKSVCHGGLGWSTIALVRNGSRSALVDVGTFGQRELIRRFLADMSMREGDITDVLLTHAHHDHMINWVMFDAARIVIGQDELHWSCQQRWGSSPVPELYVKELSSWRNLCVIEAGDEVFPEMTAIAAPGHTPGGLIYYLHGENIDVIFSGDSAKNRAELISRRADASYDAAVTRASIDMIWELWQRRPGTILVPGHDLPMVLNEGEACYLGERNAAIKAWFGDDLETTSFFGLEI
jgi:glyoxylase-like metal-dependent hydrolase (beta-lactamase superfamily II)